MNPLLTPTTALFYSSILEPSAFDPPPTSSNPAAAEADIFGHAFGAHNLSKSNEAAGYHNTPDFSSRDGGIDAARFYVSPPESNEFSAGTRDPSAEDEPMQFYTFPQRAGSYPQQAAQVSNGAMGEEQPAGVTDYYNTATETQYSTNE
jgi:hypothetical protein